MAHCLTYKITVVLLILCLTITIKHHLLIVKLFVVCHGVKAECDINEVFGRGVHMGWFWIYDSVIAICQARTGKTILGRFNDRNVCDAPKERELALFSWY